MIFTRKRRAESETDKTHYAKQAKRPYRLASRETLRERIGFIGKSQKKKKKRVGARTCVVENKMVGIFSRFSVGRVGHRRTQSALDEREVLPRHEDAIAANTATTATSHGIQVAIEFKPVEHPIEPFDNDRPIQCPLPEPSILNDGRIWKERVSSTQRIPDLPVMEESGGLESDIAGTKPRSTHSNRSILPSLSAPEHNLLKLLEECNASEI